MRLGVVGFAGLRVCLLWVLTWCGYSLLHRRNLGVCLLGLRCWFVILLWYNSCDCLLWLLGVFWLLIRVSVFCDCLNRTGCFEWWGFVFWFECCIFLFWFAVCYFELLDLCLRDLFVDCSVADYRCVLIGCTFIVFVYGCVGYCRFLLDFVCD